MRAPEDWRLSEPVAPAPSEQPLHAKLSQTKQKELKEHKDAAKEQKEPRQPKLQPRAEGRQAALPAQARGPVLGHRACAGSLDTTALTRVPCHAGCAASTAVGCPRPCRSCLRSCRRCRHEAREAVTQRGERRRRRQQQSEEEEAGPNGAKATSHGLPGVFGPEPWHCGCRESQHVDV